MVALEWIGVFSSPVWNFSCQLEPDWFLICSLTQEHSRLISTESMFVFIAIHLCVTDVLEPVSLAPVTRVWSSSLD